MGIDTTFLRSRLDRLAACLDALDDAEDATARGLAGGVCALYFEVALEQSGKLLKKSLRPWFASNRQADCLTFRDVFRHAAKHGLIDAEAAERWLGYRDAVDGLVGREDDGPFDAAATDLLRDFLVDARAVADTIDDAPRE
ncbi:MAG: nucleotidyltransferase [Chloroflexi bacterium]|nr:nucleotidyltransferase [Chloroflexota bacterium]